MLHVCEENCSSKKTISPEQCWTCSSSVAQVQDLFWFVVYLHLWKIWKSVGMIIPYIMENKKCLKPPTSINRWVRLHWLHSPLWTEQLPCCATQTTCWASYEDDFPRSRYHSSFGHIQVMMNISVSVSIYNYWGLFERLAAFLSCFRRINNE